MGMLEEFEVKALIDKEKNKVLYVESDGNLVDVLFSFLIRPIGTIIKLTRDLRSTNATIGSMNNLYRSVELLELMHFRTDSSQSMLLYPRSGAEAQLRSIDDKLLLQDDRLYDYFLCNYSECTQNAFSYYYACCRCGNLMHRKKIPLYDSALKNESRRVFVKELSRYLISDELQIVPVSTAASFSLLSKQGVTNSSNIEERSFCFGADEVLILLRNVMLSKTPLTETLLNSSSVLGPNQECLDQTTGINRERMMFTSRGDGKICVKLFVSKTKEAVCFAEVDEHFTNLLFSFLTIPLGSIAKEMIDSPSIGCVHNLHLTVEGLDCVNYLISDKIRQLLLSPKIAPHFGFKKHLLGIDELVMRFYYGTHEDRGMMLATDSSPFTSKFRGVEMEEFTLLDPKINHCKKQIKSSDGYLSRPAMFTVTDNLVIEPISSLLGLATLKEMNVPFNDIEERIVHVGRGEAIRLLVAAFISKTPLTDVFLGQQPNPPASSDLLAIDYRKSERIVTKRPRNEDDV